MKKLFVYSLLALGMGFGFTACDDYEEPNPPAQSNPQEPLFEADGVKVTADESTSEALDLAALNEAGQVITLSKVEAPNVPAGYELVPELRICKDNQFNSYAVVPVTVVDNGDGNYSFTVTPDDLQGVYYNSVSHSPKQKTIYYRYSIKLVSGKSSVQVGGADTTFGPYEVAIIPFPSEFEIEDAYYLVGNICDWDISKAVALNHAGGDVYDNPVFSIKVDITAEEAAAGWWWKIIPASTQVTGGWVDAPYASYGVEENGSPDLSGMLVPRTATEDCGAGCITEPGPWLLTINFEEGTYEFSLAIDCLYTPGGSNGWSQTSSQLLYTTDYAVYTGFAHLNGDFKFTSAPDWNGLNYGAAAEEGKLTTDGGAGNLSVAANGLYWCEVNLPGLSYQTTLCNLGLVGSFTNWADGGDIEMIPSENFLVWTATNVKIPANTDWKIRANGSWAVNLGGAENNLVAGGENLFIAEEGTYDFKLDLSLVPYTVTVTKK